MFPTRFFPDRFFAPRYWPKDGVALVTGPGCFFSGEVFLGGFQSYDITFPSFPEGEVYSV